MTTIDQAKTNAQTLIAQAWTPQPVRQPDGTLLMLCYNGRLHRAYRMLGEANANGDTARVTALQGAIEKLAAMMHDARGQAEDAISQYASLTIAAGGQPDDLYPDDCTCAGCKDSGRFHRIGAAMGNCRTAIWQLMGDDGEGAPELVTLFRAYTKDEKAKDIFWRRVLRIVDAMQEYMDACQQNNEQPDWKRMWA